MRKTKHKHPNILLTHRKKKEKHQLGIVDDNDDDEK